MRNALQFEASSKTTPNGNIPINVSSPTKTKVKNILFSLLEYPFLNVLSQWRHVSVAFFILKEFVQFR